MINQKNDQQEGNDDDEADDDYLNDLENFEVFYFCDLK